MVAPHTFRKKSWLDLPRFDDWCDDFSVPSIAKRGRAETIVGLSILSGALSTVASWQMSRPYVFYLAPGVLFGLLVLLPWCRFCQISWWQTLATVCLAPLGYAAAVDLTLAANIYTLTAGLVGGGITFAPILLASQPRIRACTATALGVGWILGIPLAIGCLAWIGGVAAWQISVAYCLSNALRIDDIR